jgi:hypothetical protein
MVYLCSECTMDGSEFPWCAVEVDDAGRLVDKRWGKCDLSTCAQPSAAEQEAGQEDPRTLLLTFPTLSGNFSIQAVSVHRLNMKSDLQSFGLMSRDVHGSVHWLRHRNPPPPPAFGLIGTTSPCNPWYLCWFGYSIISECGSGSGSRLCHNIKSWIFTFFILFFRICILLKKKFGGHMSFSVSSQLSGRNLHGVPSRDSNSSLPYIKPAH